jgi:hypothetical protein
MIFCFADVSHAERFRERFGSEPFDPKDRGRGSAWLAQELSRTKAP